MPKKTRKMKQRAAMRRGAPLETETQVAEPNGAEPATPMLSARSILAPAHRVITPATFDYSYIYGDLKRIALFALFFFVVLIVLSFVIK